jgi:WD40 repeat protein
MGLEKNLIRASWDPKGEKIAAGSGDRSVVVWDFRTGKLLYKLPGHKGTVNDVRFSPNNEPISESHRICFMSSPVANPVAQLYLDRQTGRSCLVSSENKNDPLLE